MSVKSTGSPVYSAVFDNVRAGRHTLWLHDVARERAVLVSGGAVAEIDWRENPFRRNKALIAPAGERLPAREAERSGRSGILRLAVHAARTLHPCERRRAGAMLLTIALLHLIGIGVFVAFVVPSHYKGLGIGIAGLAYSLGLRHAFDADHIAAIDNTTRKLMQDGKRPLSVGYLVFARAFDDRRSDRRRDGDRREGGLWGGANSHSALEQFGGIFGTAVSATFLYLIASLNIVILKGIVKVFFERCAMETTTRTNSSATSRAAG